MSRTGEITEDQAPAHSPVGASGYHRWRHCPGSVRLSRGIESNSSVWADEGTQAHELAEKILTARANGKPEPDLFDVTEEMYEAVMVYVEHMQSLQRPGCVQLYEHRFHLADIHELCFGTADGVTYYPDEKLLVISDFKYGSGVFVDATENEQLLYYAVGAVVSLGFKVERVRVEIIQPRISDAAAIRPWETDIFDLMMFAEQLREDVARTQDQSRLELQAGDWCRWCPAAAVCPLLKLIGREETEKVFEAGKQSPLIDYRALADALDWLPVLSSWITSTREFAYNEAMRGKKIPRYKLVEKRPQRQYKNEESVARAVTKKFKVGPSVTHIKREPELRSPAQMIQAVYDHFNFLGKKVKKKDIEKFVDGLTDKISSGSTLVNESDNREAIQPQDPKSVFQPTEKTVDPLS